MRNHSLLVIGLLSVNIAESATSRNVRLPMVFEPNQGQADPQVRFLARGHGYMLYLTDTEAVMSKRGAEPVRMSLHNAALGRVAEGMEPTGGISNYFIGNDPQQWHTRIPHYQRVKYSNVYKGVDLIYYDSGGKLEYDLVVAPGADTSRIEIGYQGVESMKVDASGDLLLKTSTGELRQLQPKVYQNLSGHRIDIDARYRITSDYGVAFELAKYDRSQPLVIDPVLVYSTYLGGSGQDSGIGIAVDRTGSAYIVGQTTSADFPLAGAFQTTNSSGDAYVTRINASGSAIIYSTFLGGTNSDLAASIALDSSGNAYITGATSSSDFPVKSPLQPKFGGMQDAFVTKLNSSGSALIYSTYLGGSDFDNGSGIAIDASGNAYITGGTASSNFPTVNALQVRQADEDGYVTKINATGSSIVYSTYLGGQGFDSGRAIAVDTFGSAYIAGTTRSTDFPSSNGSVLNGINLDLFVTKINAAGTARIYSYFYGGTSNEDPTGIAVDSAGAVYVTGATTSSDLPLTNAIQATYGGNGDAFVAKFSSGGVRIFSTYLGGSNEEFAGGIAVDGHGSIYVVGVTGSANFPNTNPLQSGLRGGTDAYLVKINSSGTAKTYSTWIGGTAGDSASGVAVDGSLNAYVVGTTSSSDFPIAKPIQASDVRGNEAFLLLVSDSPLPFVTIAKSHQGNFFQGQQNAVYTITVSNAVNAATYSDGATVTETVPAGMTLVSMTGTGWNCASNTCSRTDILNPGGSYPAITVKVNVAVNATSPLVNQASLANASALQLDTTSDSTVITAQPVLSAGPAILNFHSSGTLITSPQTVTVTFANGSDTWTATSNQANITVSPASGNGNGTFVVTAAPGSSGVVTVTAPGAAGSPKTIQVNVATATIAPPFGSFDTPANNTAGIAGAIAVTGWALDNIEVASVGVWREKVGTEPVASNGLVFVGNAVFVSGARPDVESANPGVPYNYRAGWGYLLLTNFLPNSSGSGPSGNGTYKLHAIAVNRSGQTTDLGTHAITVDNAHASRPFGTIDTPDQGATISGNHFVNFGWGLTQNPFCIPTDGSTITVTVDGVTLGHPTYNQNRSDIATAFPGLCNSAGAIGFFFIDTTTLTNGVHTIGWLVFDNQGRGDGVGSRFFNVLNAGAAPAAPPEEPVVEEQAHRALDSLALDPNGVRILDVAELGRVAIASDAVGGYQVVNGERRDLPAGSTIQGGTFYWQLGPGFFGSFDLILGRADGQERRLRIRVGYVNDK